MESVGPLNLLKGSETFYVPEFVEENLDIQQSAEALAEYFSSISREFQPLNIDELSPAIKDELKRGINEVKIPILEEHQVYEKITRAKKPHSTVPGDLKRLLVKECSVELISPVTKIYNEITRSKEFPRAWVIEQQTPIPKVKTVSSLDDLRNILGTPFF